MPFQKKEKEAPAPKQAVIVPESEAEKFKALFALSNMLDKKHSTTNSLIQLGKRQNLAIRALPTNLPSLDNDVLGAGGLPRGRVIEVFGPESAGKTTATLHFIACEQRLGGISAFVDAEHALDPAYAANLGVDVDKLVISQPSSGEEALDIVLELVKSRLVTLIVVDSVAALVPQAELTGEMGDSHVGLQARLMSQAMRKLVGLCWDNQVTVIFINQIREKIGVMFGSPETTTGGRALKFYSSIRIDVRRREVINEGGKDTPIIGHTLELQAVKNKVGNPFRKTKIDLYYPGHARYACGFDTVGDLITYSSTHGFFEMSGSWYWLDLGNKDEKTGKAIGNERLANGLAALKDLLRDNTKVLDVLRAKAVAYHKASLIKPVEAAKAV